MKVELIDSMGGDLAVVNAARVSFNKRKEELDDKDIKLIHYLAKNGHWTPFGHCQATIRVTAPVYIARQLVKHQVGLVWNEVSRRYVDTLIEFEPPQIWNRRPENGIKQGNGGAYTEEAQHEIRDEVNIWLTEASSFYNKLLDAGVAPEQARTILPICHQTEWVWTGSLMAFARIYKLRADPHTQAETQEFATLLDTKMVEVAPHSWEALTR